MRFIAAVILLFSLSLKAQICKNWGEPFEIDQLDHTIINEASGIIKSQYKDRLYHVNDSGDGPYFYQTDLNGKSTQKIKVMDLTLSM